MKITVKQLKQLIREQIEEVYEDEDLNPENIQIDWETWLEENGEDLKRAIRATRVIAGLENVHPRKRTAAGVQLAKKRFFAMAEGGDDMFLVDIDELIPELGRAAERREERYLGIR